MFFLIPLSVILVLCRRLQDLLVLVQTTANGDYAEIAGSNYYYFINSNH